MYLQTSLQNPRTSRAFANRRTAETVGALPMLGFQAGLVRPLADPLSNKQRKLNTKYENEKVLDTSHPPYHMARQTLHEPVKGL